MKAPINLILSLQILQLTTALDTKEEAIETSGTWKREYYSTKLQKYC